MIIYLCDLTHTAQGHTSELVPYGIGCIRSYLLKNRTDDVQLFKEVPLLDEAIKRQPPDIVGLSNYMWNSNLSLAIAKRIKEAYPWVMVVFGGPHFPLEEDKQELWMREHPQGDAYVLGEGEIPFVDIVEAFEHGGVEAVRLAKIYGVCTLNNDKLQKNIISYKDGTDAQPRMLDLEEVPSPYLNGSMDAFLAHPMFVPAIACNRGCPFTCTYCACGVKACTKVARHSVQRIVDELEYIAGRYNGHTLHIIDANFGQYLEDVSISKAIGRIKARTGFPKWIIVATGKNRKERVREVAENVTGSLRVAASVQSMDPGVLKLIKRDNISRDELIDLAGNCDNGTYTEMIMPLPGETINSYINGVCELIDMDFDQIRLHQLVLLPGSEMETSEQRELHGFDTRFRVLQRSYGRYEFIGSDLIVAEMEEVVVGHDSFSFAEFLHARSFALTVALFHNDGIFSELAGYLASQDISYTSFLQFVHAELLERSVPGFILNVYSAFIDSAQVELFGSRNELDAVVAKDDGIILKSKDIGNNLLYNTQGFVLAHNYNELCEYAFGAADALLTLYQKDLDEDYLSELKAYCKAKKGHIAELDAVEDVVFHYDFAAQEEIGWGGIPDRCEPIQVRFSFEQWQKDLFSGQMEKYGSDARGLGKIVARSNMSQTYRGMVILLEET